jgi:hypothetical protein
MLSEHWHMLWLRLNTPHLEFRHPSDQELGQLADLAAEGIHEPDQTPFPCPGAVCLRRSGRSVVRAFGGAAALAAPRELVGGRPGPGPSGLRRRPDRRPANPRRSRLRDRWQASTFSWLGLRHRAGGIGTEMRAAVLHLAFAGIDAAEATSGAFDDNTSSLTRLRETRLRTRWHRTPRRPRSRHHDPPSASVSRPVAEASAHPCLDHRACALPTIVRPGRRRAARARSSRNDTFRSPQMR